MRPAPGFLHNTTFLLKPEKIILRLIALVLINGAYLKVNAQGGESEGGGCSSFISSYCSNNYTDTIAGLLIDSIMTGISYGVSNTNLKDVLYQKDVQKCSTYTAGDVCQDGLPSLNFFVFYPKTYNGNSIGCKIPAVIIFHGGSYFECSLASHEETRDICRQLAKRGFVVFNVEYRRGVLLDNQKAPNQFQKISVQQVLAIYRANQDARGAIRSIIKMQRNNVYGFGTTFKIDTTRIFVGGQSAGAVMAMGAAYYERQGQIDSAFSSGGINLSNSLGPLDASWYYGDASIDYKPMVIGVLSMWGGLPVHRSFYGDAANYFRQNTKNPPLIGFVGFYDSTFPPGKNYFYFSTRTTSGGVNYKTETLCLLNSSFANPDDVLNPPDPTVNADAVCIGIDTLHAAFERLTTPKNSEVYIDCQMGHGLDPDSVGVTYKSEFGTGALTKTAVNNYIAGRAATYFTAIMNTSPLSGIKRTRFVECSNTRIYCDVPGDTSTGCGYMVADQDSQHCTGP